jgi:lipoprotein-releasing system ATP-binding protein
MIISQNRHKSIKLEDVSKFFRQANDEINVLSGINFQFEQDFSYALTGVSGTGKSTLLHIIAGFDNPSKGKVYYNSMDIGKLSKKDKKDFLSNSLGFLFQSPYLVNELTIIENAMLKGLISGKSYEDCLPFALELLEKLGLNAKAQYAPYLLSGGEQQRVALARALFTKPCFLIADEPTAHLDDLNKNIIIDLLLAYQKEWKMGLIVATHDPFVTRKMEIRLKICNGNLYLIN